jgi:hypothetical protein
MSVPERFWAKTKDSAMARNRLLRTAPRLALLSAFGLFCFGAQKKMTMLTVTATAYRVIPHEGTIEDQAADDNNTTCYGSGTYFGYTSNTAVNCSTITTPPQTRSAAIRTIEVFNQLEASGTIYTVRCSAHWVGSNCSWLIPGVEFWAEIQGRTMWVSAHEGGNTGKEIHPKFQVLDIRTKPVMNVLPRSDKAGDQLDNGAIVEMIKRGVSEDSIIAMINARPGSYALYPDALPALRTVGVSQSVLAAMSVNNAHPRLPPAQDAENPNSKTFVVTGKVKHPGKFELRDGMRVMDAIGKAGGFADSFNRKKITITRDGEQHNFNYADFIHGRNIEQNILMQNGDVVEVP